MLSNIEIGKFIEEVKRSSIRAGAAIMEIYDSADFGVLSKSDDSPLTKADLAANKILCDTLRSISPDIPIISEENDQLDYEERSQWDYCWVVDPLDGTKEFIKRNGEFTTNVGLVYQGRPIAGVIYAPVLKQLFWNIPGQGAFVERGEERSMQVAGYADQDVGLKVVCSRSHLNDATKAIVDQYQNPELVASGSSLKFMKLALGDAHVYPRMAPTMEWDTCAAQAILVAAGGRVYQADTKTDLEYNKENLLNPSFIAVGRAQ